MRKLVFAALIVAPSTLLSATASFANDADDCSLAALIEPELCPTGAAIAQNLQRFGEALQGIARFRSVTAEASAEVAGYRQAFFYQLDAGARNSKEEQEFSEVLFEKDIYYMSLYTPNGAVKGKQDVERIDKLGGKPIGGGINPLASTQFGEWVTAIRTRLGARNNEFIFTSPIAFREAFEASKAEYQAYKRARDKIELGTWQLSRRPRLPKPTTIDEIVDQYFETTLGPEVKQKVSLLNGSAKQDAEQTALDWARKLRRVIIDYESFRLTPDGIAAALRSYGRAFSENEIASVLVQIRDLPPTDQTAIEARSAAALGRIIQAHDRAAGIRYSVVNEDMIALDLRTRAYRQTTGKLSPNEAEAVSKDPKWKDIHDKLWYYSSGPGHEVAYGVTPYANTRPYIVAGNMRGALPPIPGQPTPPEPSLSPEVQAELFPMTAAEASKAARQADEKAAADAGSREARARTEADEAARRQDEARRAEDAVAKEMEAQAARRLELARRTEDERRTEEAAQVKAAQLAAERQEREADLHADVVGVRLGMGFAQAEALVRAHMVVGRVLQGARAWTAQTEGLPKPLTSGKLFVSADGTEMIALIDEPPAAAETVLAAWRLFIVPASMSGDQVLADLQNKYGTPNSGELRPNAPAVWFGPRGEPCLNTYDNGQFIDLSTFWRDEGKPVVFSGAYFPQGPLIPLPLLDPTGDQSKAAANCGPFVTAQYFQSFTPGASPVMISMLSDIGRYADAYAAGSQNARPASASTH
jgi:hypothetical protein